MRKTVNHDIVLAILAQIERFDVDPVGFDADRIAVN